MANKFVKSFNFGGEDNYFPLPIVGAEHEGMVMKVVDGEWEAASLITEPAVTLINFTIYHYDDAEPYNYQAAEGMTWAEWFASDYNTYFTNYEITEDLNGGDIIVDTYNRLADDSENAVSGTDTINADMEYMFIGLPG